MELGAFTTSMVLTCGKPNKRECNEQGERTKVTRVGCEIEIKQNLIKHTMAFSGIVIHQQKRDAPTVSFKRILRVHNTAAHSSTPQDLRAMAPTWGQIDAAAAVRRAGHDVRSECVHV
jgi:hypothetical protein